MKCWWIFFHKWGNWIDQTFILVNKTKRIGQQRFCLKCNKCQINRL